MRQSPILGLAVFAIMAANTATVRAQSAQAQSPRPAASVAAAVPAAAPLSAAAAQLHQLLDLRVDDEAVELGARLIRDHPDDAALHALHVISLMDYHHSGEALRLSDEQVARWPDDPWVQVARGYVIRDWAVTDEALTAAARARQLAPGSPEIAHYVMRIYSRHSAWG